MPAPADQRVLSALAAASVSLQFAYEDARDAGDYDLAERIRSLGIEVAGALANAARPAAARTWSVPA